MIVTHRENRMRTLLLPLHIVSAAGLVGADLALVALGIRGVAGGPAGEVYPAMSLVAATVMLPLGAAALATGLALARVTGVGLRTGWVAAKLSITLLLAAVLIGFLVPGLASVADTSTGPGGLATAPPQYAIGPAVSATLLTLNVLLATTRPTRLLPVGRRVREA
jgi:hypothetical protein